MVVVKIQRAALILFAMILSLGISCKKPEEAIENPYYVRFKIDGVLKEYKANTIMKFGKNGTDNYFLAAKVQKNDNEFPLIRFDISGIKQPITTQLIYTNSGSLNAAVKMYYGDNRVDEFATNSGIGDFKFEVTEKTDSYVKGTFSGTIIETYVYVPLEKKLTEGTFFLEAVNQ